MKVACRIFHSQPVGSADVVHVHEAESTVAAVLMSITRLEADGVDISNLHSIAIVAKAYPAGASLLADPEMIGRPAKPTNNQEPTSCAA